MSRPSLDETYLAMLKLYAARSTCYRRAVAAIITDCRGRILGAGFNGVPRGMIHCTTSPCGGTLDPPGDTRNCWAIHAEINALLQCSDRERMDTMYCSCTPCFECAKAIANTSIKRIVVAEPYADERGIIVLNERGIDIVIANVT
jgi:dCMP deaminase